MVVVFLVEYDLTRDGRVVVTCFSGLFRYSLPATDCPLTLSLSLLLLTKLYLS